MSDDARRALFRLKARVGKARASAIRRGISRAGSAALFSLVQAWIDAEVEKAPKPTLGGMTPELSAMVEGVILGKNSALEDAARECERIYAVHRKTGTYPIDMGGLAKECASAIRAMKSPENPKKKKAETPRRKRR